LSLDVVFIDGLADGVRRTYPHLDLPQPQLFLFDHRTGRAGACYRQLDERPGPDGGWRYQLRHDPPGGRDAGPVPGGCRGVAGMSARGRGPDLREIGEARAPQLGGSRRDRGVRASES